MRYLLLSILLLTQTGCLYVTKKIFYETPKAKYYDIDALVLGMTKEDVKAIMGKYPVIYFNDRLSANIDSIENYPGATYEYSLRKGYKLGSVKIEFDSTMRVTEINRPDYRRPIYFYQACSE